jgi:hypothetical protein
MALQVHHIDVDDTPEARKVECHDMREVGWIRAKAFKVVRKKVVADPAVPIRPVDGNVITHGFMIPSQLCPSWPSRVPPSAGLELAFRSGARSVVLQSGLDVIHS